MLCKSRLISRIACRLPSSSSCSSYSPSRALPFFFRTMATKFDGVVIGIHEGGKFTQQGELLNEKSNGALKKQWELTSKKGKSGESTLVLGALPEYPRISIVGLGKEEKDREEGEDNIHAQRLAAGLGVKSLKANGAKMVGVDSSFGNLQATSEGTHMSLYKYYLKKAKEDDTPIEVAPFSVESAETPAEWQNGKIIAQAQNLARDLAETPANLMTPTIFCNTISEKFTALENKDKVEVVIRDEKWIQEKGMGMFWGVAKGSIEPPRLLEVHYKGASDSSSPPLVFVGKGVTFDSGGISIKPSANMSLMKGDMQGAASVVSAAYAVALLKLPINLTVITPLAENMPSGGATKPGDVLTAINKKTVEIDNTDAEGRLLLGDALYYAHSFNPHTLVDVATLTGAIEVALGTLAAGAFTPSDALWNELSEASKKTNERFWRMPLYKEYKKQLESRVADLMNSSPKRSGGACTAAIFLKEFTEIERWAHLDIAGIMQNSDDSAIASKGLSGKPVRTLVELAKTYINAIPATPVKKDKQ